MLNVDGVLVSFNNNQIGNNIDPHLNRQGLFTMSPAYSRPEGEGKVRSQSSGENIWNCFQKHIQLVVEDVGSIWF